MFHIKSLELVHWDYWQRIKNIPLDAKIITIAGQNGSGKTTLLDALRTLFGLDCSMGRTYKHYARHSGQQTAWLRAVVDNKNVGKQLSNRPFRSSGFFSDDEVTLFCQIQKNGGDWKRQYLMRPGNVQIEDITDANDWLGVENYRKRLANAGLSPAMSKVLALEQGETDKLCEYAPRQLLDLVFQVFGDKEVLDAYDEAKRHQRDTEVELKRFETELKASKTNLEGLRLRVANYHQWEGLHKERRNLLEEVLPSLQYHEAREKAAIASRQLRDARKPMAQADQQLTDKRNALAAQAKALSDAQMNETLLEQESIGLQSRLSLINSKLKPLDSLLEQKDRLHKLAADSGSDIAEVAAQLEQKEAELLRQRQQRDALSARIAGEQATIAALQGKTAMPEPDNVRGMRRALRDAGIPHAMLSDIVEVTDSRWQGAVEGVLGGYASVVLLDKAKDAAAAYRLAEKERYRHFIVPDLVTAPVAKDESLLAVVKFSAPVPSWLIEQLSRIARVDSVEAGFKLGNHEEWITPEAYHRERRGGRSLFVEASRYRFGQAGRSGRLEALLRSLPGLEGQEDTLTLAISKLAAEVGALKARIAGVDAAKELSARQEEFAEALRNSKPLKEERLEVGGRLGELQNLTKNATVARTRADTVWQNARLALSEAEAGSRLGYKKQIEQRAEHARALLALRHAWRHLPKSWRRPARRAALVAEHQNAHQVDLRVASLQNSLARDDWELDATVIDQHHRLSDQLHGRQSETDERRYQNNRAIEATGNARGAYMERLRYTIKTYSKNIKELGELAGIEVHADPVRLENDDVQLSQAGLHVRFKFDGKGVIGMNDGEASGGQQVMKSLVLLIGLLKSEDGSGGFVFIDEPFAHLDIRNIQLVGEFLKNTEAQYLMTTPLTHNTDVYDPSELTLITSKKKKDTQWAQPIFVLQRRVDPVSGKGGMMIARKLVLAAALSLALAGTAVANDGIGSVSAGGILFGKTDAVAMKKEVLSVSTDLIKVEYEFLNESARDVEETIFFPLPEYAAGYHGSPTYYGQPQQFTVDVDGKRKDYKTTFVAKLDSADVTARLRQLGLSDAQIAYFPSHTPFDKKVAPLTAAQSKIMIREGLLAQLYDEEWVPAWTVKVIYLWQQKFPAGKVVRVRHQYAPFVAAGPGASYLGDGNTFEKKYCGDKAFYKTWNRLAAKQGESGFVNAVWVSYILTTGNTWKNGIEDFTLNLIKGKPDELVSLCFPGTFTKINPTTLQVKLRNFHPKQDLDVYFGNVEGAGDHDGVAPQIRP